MTERVQWIGIAPRQLLHKDECRLLAVLTESYPGYYAVHEIGDPLYCDLLTTTAPEPLGRLGRQIVAASIGGFSHYLALQQTALND